MSFDVLVISFHHGTECEADAVAARSVLARFQFHHEPAYNVYDINFSDGSEVELYAKGLDATGGEFRGGVFTLRGQSDEIGRFIFEFSQAAGCVIIPAMEPQTVLLPRADLADHLPGDLAEKSAQVPVANGAEVLAALSGGYATWRAYRDQVVGEGARHNISPTE